jgi:hypothetical protein
MASCPITRRSLAVLLISLALILPSARAGAQSAPKEPPEKAAKTSGTEIVVHGGYPELRVDGRPFFIHSAAFFYYRIPRESWSAALDRYRGMGINTIDIYIPWNWHELTGGNFDFDGHTHPRRNLRELLKLISEKNLKLIARPGPLILNEWRWGGYPGWLLQRPDFPAADSMDEIAILEGRYPPLAALATRDAEAAATGWLDNPVHMAAAGKWLEAVAGELAPYAAGSAAESEPEEAAKKEHSGKATGAPLLFVQLDDDAASGRTNNAGPNFWQYMTSLCDSLRAGGLNVPVFINPTDMRVAASGSALPEPIGAMGQWYMHSGANADAPERALGTEDASTIEFFTEELKTQPLFPPALIEYQAGWYAPGDDDRPAENPPANTLESSRLFLANGLHGISYFPLQDTLTPATYSVPWANQAYLWGAAFDLNGHRQKRAEAVQRNGDFLKEFGPRLAASHKRADFGIVYPIGAYAQTTLAPADVLRVSDTVQKIERLAQLGHLSSELLDPEYQPVDELLRDPLVFLPVFDSEGKPLELSEKAQQSLVEYVRRGGTLFSFPSRPEGKIIAQLWDEAPTERADVSEVISASWKSGAGRVIESSKDFYSWIKLKDSVEENRAQEIAAWANQAVGTVLTTANIHPAVQVAGNPARASNLIVTELVSNEGTNPLGARTGGEGWISVTNLDADETVDALIAALSPDTSSIGDAARTVTINVSVPPKESLLLPLEIPICYDVLDPATCKDAVIASGAEYLGAVREGKSLELNFYTPATAEVRLHLDHVPSHISLQDSTVEGQWNPDKQELTFSLMRGASPTYFRQVKLQMPYVPHAPVMAQPLPNALGDFEVIAANAACLPLGPSTYFLPFPPLIVFEDPRAMRVVFQGTIPIVDKTGDIELNISGAYRGSASLHVIPGLDAVTDMMLRPASGPSPSGKPYEPDANGLVHGSVELRGGHDREQIPISFLTLREGGTTAYRFDYDGDGVDEWVLENSGLRLIISPRSGGRALALVAKENVADLFSSVGGLRDNFLFTPNPPGISPDRERGRYGLFNRTYAAEWAPDNKNTALKLHYHAPDVYPSGATIEKTLELDGSDSFHATYIVTLDKPAAAGDAAAQDESRPQSFVEVNSLPTVSDSVRVTRLCWTHETPGGAPDKSSLAAGASPPQETPPQDSEHAQTHCEDFVPGGPGMDLPADANHLELRTRGRPGIALDWDSGRMSIEPKRYSVLLKLQSPPLMPGVELKTTTKFHVLPAE